MAGNVNTKELQGIENCAASSDNGLFSCKKGKTIEPKTGMRERLPAATPAFLLYE
jgi:hypothetical protein